MTELSRAVIELENASVYFQNRQKLAYNLKNSFDLRSFLTGSGSSQKNSQYCALSNINCSIYQGERVALIGSNGSGKTTFLRVISGILKPSTGSLKASTSVYPLLHKSFITGDELPGIDACKGYYLMTRQNLRGFAEFMQEILDFTELYDYIDQPMKTYSEGMKARLIFSLLTSQNQDCIAMDEGFGTADSNFFRKAQLRIESFINESGTLLLASHSDDLLRRFCDRGLVFSKGQIVFDASLEESLCFYHETYD